VQKERPSGTTAGHLIRFLKIASGLGSRGNLRGQWGREQSRATKKKTEFDEEIDAFTSTRCHGTAMNESNAQGHKGEKAKGT